MQESKTIPINKIPTAQFQLKDKHIGYNKTPKGEISEIQRRYTNGWTRCKQCFIWYKDGDKFCKECGRRTTYKVRSKRTASQQKIIEKMLIG